MKGRCYMVQEKKSKRLSRKLQKSYVIKTDIDELSDVLCELFNKQAKYRYI